MRVCAHARQILLATVVFSGVVPVAARAQGAGEETQARSLVAERDVQQSAPATSSRRARAGKPGHVAAGHAAKGSGGVRAGRGLQAHPAASGPVQAQGAEHVDVHADPVALHAGGGLLRPQDAPKAISVVGADFIGRQAPSATAFDLVALLPGANVASSDPLGFSPQTNISVRGLNGDAIGYVLEGAPLNDIAYYTGYPSQFADSENYDSIALQQGAADLDSPVLNAAGGLMSLRFRTPAEKAGGQVDISYGSYDTNREFIRLESGEIGKTGLRGFVSYSHAASDNWRGPGRDVRQHVDFKLQKDWGRGNTASLLGSWNQAIDSYYPQVSKESWAQDGIHGANNLARRYDMTNAAAGTDYWRLYRQPERTLYLAAPVSLHLAHGLTLKATPYAQGAYGNAPGGTQIPTSGLYNGTQPLADALTLPSTQDGWATVRADYTQRSYRSGFTAALDWKRGVNDLVLGYWYDYSDDTEKQQFTAVSDGGYAANIWGNGGVSGIHLSDGSLLLGTNNHTVTQTNALFLGDRLSLLHERLLLTAGFKEVMMTRTGTNAMPGAAYHANTNSAVPLPRLAARFQITPHHQVFFSATTNFRTPAETALYDVFDPTSGQTESKGSTHVKNEYSISEELGYRYADDRFVGSVTLFNYNFTNRQVATLISENGSFVQSTMNAGGQTSRGVDVEFGLRPWHHLSPYVSGEYLHATIDNDIETNGDLLPTRGKTAVRSPTLQAAAGLTYDDGHFFGTATVKYTGHQYATFMNDERMSDHVTGNLAVGYRLADVAMLHKPEFRMNFINISNQHYLSGVADPTLNAKDTTGRYGTTLAGSAPDYYVGGGFAALFTASTGF
ncbi:TonB-dependent receptor [Acetobacter persici]|uniref:TonB-dependent receptor n=1 Tax=Acetobacter persici TaxID=1076596 RepID=UPI0039E9DDD1